SGGGGCAACERASRLSRVAITTDSDMRWIIRRTVAAPRRQARSRTLRGDARGGHARAALHVVARFAPLALDARTIERARRDRGASVRCHRRPHVLSQPTRHTVAQLVAVAIAARRLVAGARGRDQSTRIGPPL